MTLRRLLLLCSLSGILWGAQAPARPPVKKAAAKALSAESQACLACHEMSSPGIVGQWKRSTHAKSAIGCFECHKADKGDRDGFDHNGAFIAVIVSPKDCSSCHPKEYKEFQASHHSEAAKILGSLDNVLAEVVEGNMKRDSPAAVSGCWQCHGSEVKVLAEGKLDPTTWPNTGMGRLNPDGSKGSCSACHIRHNFSRAQARMPENCGRCHMGPDHPQIEVYTESKHGIAFAANRTRYEPLMEKKQWIPGKDFEQGPTCTTCHMSATADLPLTHDVGSRISWTLRPPVSEKIDAAAKAAGRQVKTWEARRGDMKQVCTSCHAPNWVDNWYQQFDSSVGLYNDKFGRPATRLFNMVRSANLISNDIEFDDPLEFTYFFLWHHEGRRARHGVAMMGPDYTQWHGNFEVAHRFYMEFVPQLREVLQKASQSGDPAKVEAARKVEAELDQILNSENHRWFLGKTTPAEREARKKAAEEFKKRYAQ
ncbi:MAG: hydroxylamine oxidoreductase [Acidobacteria bacterium]|nr:hydroxylamine oxidoreductase [Acidobacteriota bacterium]MBI3470991.1 hydroxylamine oxidoreductase [Candidatus Solibacter usitatus]